MMRQERMEDTKILIRSVLIPVQSGLSIRNFQREYKKCIGQNIPFQKWGFENIEEFLKSIPDVVSVQWDNLHGSYHLFAISDETTAHIQRLVSKQRNSRHSAQAQRARSSYSPFVGHCFDQKRESLAHSRGQLSQTAFPHGNDDLLFFNGKERDKKLSTSGLIGSTNAINEPCAINDATKSKFRKVLEANPNGCWLSKFGENYKDLIGEDLKFEELGYESLISLVNALSDVFVRVRPHDCKTDWLLFSVDSTKHQFIQTHCIEDLKLDNEMILNLRSLLRRNTDGIYVRELPDIYMQNFQVSLQFNKFGFHDIGHFLLGIAERIPLKIVGEKVKLSNSFYYSMKSANSALLFIQKQTPEDISLPGVNFVPQQLPDSSNAVYNVIMCHCISPQVFYVQLAEQRHKLQDMMSTMGHLYESTEGQVYKLQDHHIMVGMVCAVLWEKDEVWYRASVMGIPLDETKVHVFLVDFGIRVTVQRSVLYYLRKQLAEYPSQAFKVHIPGVMPKTKDYWEKNVAEWMLNYCRNKILCGEILGPALFRLHGSSLKDSDGSLPISLCDCTGEKDIFVTPLLVKENLATYLEPSVTSTCVASSEAVHSPTILVGALVAGSIPESEEVSPTSTNLFETSEDSYLTDSEGSKPINLETEEMLVSIEAAVSIIQHFMQNPSVVATLSDTRTLAEWTVNCLRTAGIDTTKIDFDDLERLFLFPHKESRTNREMLYDYIKDKLTPKVQCE